MALAFLGELANGALELHHVVSSYLAPPLAAGGGEEGAGAGARLRL